MANVAKHPGSLKVEKTLDEATAAAKTELASGLTLSVAGTSYTVPDLITKLESYQTLFSGTRSMHDALREQILKRDRVRPEVVTFLASLKGVLVGLYGAGSAELLKFGFSPAKKRAPLTAEQLLARATKAKATRAKRNTMGKKQRAAVKAVGTPIITATMPTEAPGASAPEVPAEASPVASAATPEGSSPSSAPSPAPTDAVPGAAPPVSAPAGGAAK